MYRSYPVPTNLQSAIEMVQEKALDMCWDIGHEMIYGGAVFDLEHLHNLKDTYERAEDICQRYLDNNIDIGEFCRIIAAQDLTGYLIEIREFLPYEIIIKYRLNIEEEEEKSDKEEPGDEELIINMLKEKKTTHSE